jgi:hypothetical protein
MRSSLYTLCQSRDFSMLILSAFGTRIEVQPTEILLIVLYLLDRESVILIR